MATIRAQRTTAERPLDETAQIVTEAQELIRTIIARSFFERRPYKAIAEECERIIKRAVKKLRLPVMRDSAVRSLRMFYRSQHRKINEIPKKSLYVFLALQRIQNQRYGSNLPIRDEFGRTVINGTKTALTDFVKSNGVREANLYGTPLKQYMQEYTRDKLIPTLNEFAERVALDPDDISGRNSLRNRAEMEVRYQDHIDNIDRLKKAGIRLVICSAHADCSERCSKWQGRVFSLDGTSGRTDDGREYVPIETATDIWYTTKAGKRYKNGLLGFNCRHYLIPYERGYQFPKPNAEEERRQYDITKTQRRLERNARYAEAQARTLGTMDKTSDEYKKAISQARRWRSEYNRYCEKNDRAYYPSRIKLI